MLDIEYIRENTEKVKEACRNKNLAVDVDRLLVLDKQRRKFRFALDEVARKRNELARQAKGDKPDQQIIEEGKKLKEKAKSAEDKLKEAEQEYNNLMLALPNIPTDDTPVGKDESANEVIRSVGDKPQFDFEPKEHWELGQDLDVIDLERAAKVTGARFVYLKGQLVLMQFALIQYVLSVLTDRAVIKEIIEKNGWSIADTPFIPVVPPVMVRPEVMQSMDRLEPKEERYYIPGDDLYLVGSAEHTLGPMHMEETLRADGLPIRYVGYSTSFRREAGSYGKDLKGILRVHQFDKMEMEVLSLPENGLAEQELIVAIQEHIVHSLGLPYQVMMVSTGDMGKPDARQIDINTWLPGQDKYRETHTSDFMSDYQSRRLKIKVKRENGSGNYVYMNDATAIALGRMLIAIMENYQEADGSIKVPKVLQKYLPFKVIDKG
ncbi:MAG: serine--tRNA ligase [bacterium]|nr:serine--tRNA ligase [bacterium]MDZ4345233.1 serine--tRNA ligase [Candidatus Binatia bacterium]